MNPMRFVICRTDSGYHVRYADAKNGKVILWSENYARLADAEKAVRLTRTWARTAPLAHADLRKRKTA